MRSMVRHFALIVLFALTVGVSFAEEVKPLKVLLITGGCCHDYKAQKDILKTGLEARANCVVDLVHTDDKTTKPPLAILGKPDYAAGYDVVIHDECAADVTSTLAKDPKKPTPEEIIKETEMVDAVLKPHLDGIPAVNLHCAMHSYRFGDFGKPVAAGAANSHWYEYMGLQTTGHGAQEPIAITFPDKENPITKGLEDWITMKEELYNNIQVFPATKVIAKGKQKENEKVVVWSSEFGPKKTKVFSTTIGHNNATVQDPRYLDLVTRGMLWACDKLNDKYLKAPVTK